VRLTSIFILLVYWSFIILAPVLAINNAGIDYGVKILPKEKPINFNKLIYHH